MMRKDFDIIIYKMEFLPFSTEIKSFEISLIYDLLSAYYQYTSVIYSISRIIFILGTASNSDKSRDTFYNPFDIIPKRFHNNFKKYSKILIKLKLNRIKFVKHLIQNKPLITTYLLNETSSRDLITPIMSNYIRIVSSNLKTYDPPLRMIKAVFSIGAQVVVSSNNNGENYYIQLLMERDSNLNKIKEVTNILKATPQISGNYKIELPTNPNISINDIFFLTDYAVSKKNVFEILRTIPEVLFSPLNKVDFD